MRRKEVCVELPVSNAVSRKKAVKASSLDLVDRMGRITLDGNAPIPTANDPGNSLGKLLEDSSSPDVHQFSAFLSSPTFLSLVSPNATSATTIQKLGEASYSEVFGLTAGGGESDVVVKVIPLLQLGSDVRNEVELPDCSVTEDVMREIEITQKMAGLPGHGFVDYLG